MTDGHLDQRLLGHGPVRTRLISFKEAAVSQRQVDQPQFRPGSQHHDTVHDSLTHRAPPILSAPHAEVRPLPFHNSAFNGLLTRLESCESTAAAQRQIGQSQFDPCGQHEEPVEHSLVQGITPVLSSPDGIQNNQSR